MSILPNINKFFINLKVRTFGKVTILLLFFLGFFSTCFAESQIRVIANASVTNTTLTQAELRMIFAGRTQYWPNGTKVTVFVLPSQSELHKRFCENVLLMFPYQIKQIWLQITYSGVGESPKVAVDQRELIEKINNTPGAIGYIELSDDLQILPEVHFISGPENEK